MVAPSKIFNYPYNNFHCSQLILHPGIGCTQFFLNNFLQHYKAALTYFSPLLISPLIIKYKTMNRELLINIVKNYLQTVNCGSLAVTSTFFFVCFLRNLLGRFCYYTTVFIPTLLGAQFCWFFPPRVLNLFTTTTSQSTIEVLMRQYPNSFTHLILHSPLMQTVLFMINSAIILHYKRKNVYKNFWFIQPHGQLNKKQVGNDELMLEQNDETGGIESGQPDNEKTKCCHKNLSCKKFILNGIKSYLIFGIPLDILSMLMRGKVPNGNQSLLSKILGKLKTFRPNMTGFFITYVGLYRLSSCMLSKYYGNLSLDLQHLLAAFLGGFSYLCVQRVNFVTLSMVLSIQILWQQFCETTSTSNKNKKLNVVVQLLKNVPFAQLIFCLNCAYLVHTTALDYPVINSLARGFLNGLTCNKTKKVYYSIEASDPQTLISEAILRPVKIFL